MAETITIRFDEVLADPRLSPRRTPIDERYLETLTEAVRSGAVLPPLLVARPRDMTAPWCACPKPDNARARAVWNAETDRIPWASRPVLPTYVLLDGLTRFHAWRAAGKRTFEGVLRDLPVGSGAEVTAIGLGANAHHGRRLTDGDLRTAVVALYLGRPTHENRESWQPEAGALSQAAIAEAVGQSQAWVSRVLRWAEFVHSVRLTEEQDPGLLRAAALAGIDDRRWRGIVWQSSGVPAMYPDLDEEGRPVLMTEGRPIWDLPLEQVKRWVAVWGAEAVEPGAAAAGDGEASAAQQRLPFGQDWYEGDLPSIPSGAREAARSLYSVAGRLSPERWDQVMGDFRPLWIDVTQTWEALRKHGRRLGKEV